jgi:hypothetical protein
MLHFEVEKTNLWLVFWGVFLKSQFLFISDIPVFQVGGPVNQQIKNMWPYPGDKNWSWIQILIVILCFVQ